MFGSKIRNIAKSLLFVNSAFFAPKKLGMVKKIGLITASFMLLPGYVYLSSENKSSDTHQQPIEVNNDNLKFEQAQSQQSNNNQVKQQQNKTQAKTDEQKQVKDQIINYIKQFEDAQKLNLKGHTLIWYQSSGVKEIDEQVTSLLKKFVQQKNQNLSCPYKIIIDTTKRSKQMDQSDYYKKQIQLVVVKPDSLKPIPLGKHLSYRGTKDLKYQSLFQRIAAQINQFHEVNFKNIKQFMNGLGNRTTEAYILMTAPKKEIKWRRTKKRFSNFLETKEAFNGHAVKAIITDQQSIKYLGLPQYEKGQDNIFILLPDSENIVNPGKIVVIQNKKYHVYYPEQVNSSVVFPPYLQKSNPESLTLRLTVDLNQNITSQLSQIYQTLSKVEEYPILSSIPRFINYTSITEKNSKPIQISVQKNNFDQIVNAYSPESRYSNRQKRQLIYSGHKWVYDHDEVTPDSLEQWIKNVAENKIEPTYQSERKQQTKVKQYNSRRITGQQYLNVLEKNKNKAKIIFHYSQHCFSCKKFKHIYQQIAGQKKDNFQFFRIDNDYNRTKGLRNYNSTPIFVMYKDGKQYYYKSNVFTKTLFEDFLEITNSLKRMDTSLLEKCVKDRADSKPETTKNQ